jgi:hypothetical protein
MRGDIVQENINFNLPPCFHCGGVGTIQPVDMVVLSAAEPQPGTQAKCGRCGFFTEPKLNTYGASQIWHEHAWSLGVPALIVHSWGKKKGQVADAATFYRWFDYHLDDIHEWCCPINDLSSKQPGVRNHAGS